NRVLDLARLSAACVALALSAITLVDFMLAGGFNGEAAGTINLFGPRLGSQSPATAFNFLVAAAALMVPRGNRHGRVYGGLVAVGLAVTGFDFVGYAYDVAALSRAPTISTMSLPTMICFVLLFVSMLLARPQAGWTAVIFGKNSAGIIARRFLPTVLILPFLVNGMLVLAYRSRPFEALFGFAILAVVTSVGLVIVTVVIAAWLARHDEERQRSQDLLEAIAEGSMAVIYVKDLAGRYLLVNRRYLDIFGIDRQAVIGKTDYDIFPKDEAAAFRAMDEQVAAINNSLIEEEIIALPDGLHTYVSAKAPLRNAAGKPYAIFGISTDITDRKRSEQALAASEERTSLIVETALDAVIGIDRDGAITGWNRQAEAIFGWTHKEALGRPVEDTIMPQRFRELHKHGLARYLDTGEARVLGRRIELAGLHRDGHEFPVELSITAIRSGESVSGFTAFVRDITERKGAEARLQSQLQRLALLERITHAVGQRQDMRSIFQTVVRTLEDRLPADFVCVCSHDPLKNELTVNHVGVNSAALARALGIVEHAIIPVDENGLSRCLAGALVYEPDIAEINFPFPRRLAGQGLRSLVITPLTIEAKVFGILLVARLKPDAFVSADCEFLNQLGEHVALAAHQAQLRRGLEEAYEDLKRTQQAILQQERLRALGQMASGIAHDINNAISPVAVYTQSLLEREPNLSPRTQNYLQTVGRVIKDVSATVSRMRDFYRRSDSDSELVATNLNILIPQVVELTKARWSDMPQQRGIVIRIVNRLEENLPLVMANPAEIREAATNLIFNAVDAMPQGGTITIRTSSHDNRVRFEVQDSGVGMDEDTRRRSLEPFFTTKGERGTGLGLAMVYGTAQRHKAALDIDSTPGKGTCVRLEFAVAEAKAEQPRAVKVTEISPLRLLLVDDDPAVLESTQLVLELDGHKVVAVDGGQAGIDALRAAKHAGEPFDVMVTDLGMPYVDGNQVARAAKELSPSTTVVLLTGWGRKMGDDDGQPTNVDHVLPKPLDLDELRLVFARHLEAVRPG
ncbi:MAG TPA: PAS domain S-box protein, partial [Rhizomicrobium sp.]|nr:PAS domain S-box protein [Rhizomicrobium sp.]